MFAKCQWMLVSVYKITGDTLVISISELAAEFGMNLKYVCGLYNMPVISSVNNARFQLFLKYFSPQINNQPLSKIKGSDQSMFPQCFASAYQ